MKYGCLPPIPELPRLQFADIWTGAIPPVPSSVDYLSDSGWKMLGNDQYGDCVAVAIANYTRQVTARLGNVEDYPTLDEVLALYKTQNPRFPAQDNGMVIQYALDYCAKNGFSGRKIIAYAAVDPRNVDEVKAAIAIFGGVIPGVTVTRANEQQHSQGKPWDAVGGGSIGGHAVVCGGYSGVANDDVDFITWAKKTSFTQNFIRKQFNECWVAIFPEHLGQASFLVGVNGQALADAYKSLTGRDLPVPVPPPNPPTPPAPPAGTLEARVDGLEAKFTMLNSAVQLLARMIGDLRK